MRNRKIWKKCMALVMSAVLLVPGFAVQAEGEQAAVIYGESRGADENGFVIDENGVLKRYTGTATEVER